MTTLKKRSPEAREAYLQGYRAAIKAAARLAEDCIANGVTVLSAGEVAGAIERLAPPGGRGADEGGGHG